MISQDKKVIEKIFSCTRCGFCCHGETTVSLDDNDLTRMQQTLALSREEMFQKYLAVSKTQVQMKTIDGHCIFYTENGCFAHEGRPWRCREWPLHKAILKDEASFITVSESCPGIKKNVEYKEFCLILKGILEEVKSRGGWAP